MGLRGVSRVLSGLRKGFLVQSFWALGLRRSCLKGLVLGLGLWGIAALGGVGLGLEWCRRKGFEVEGLKLCN